MRIGMSVFLILHGLVHLLYFGQSRRLFELQPKMVWPNGSWAFSRLLGDETVRLLASIACVLAAIGFVASGIGVIAEQGWWRAAVAGAAMFSILLYVLFWDGKRHDLDDQGGIALLINIALLVAVLVLKWPDFDF